MKMKVILGVVVLVLMVGVGFVGYFIKSEKPPEFRYVTIEVEKPCPPCEYSAVHARSVKEIEDFLERDKTNELAYDEEKFNCIDFAVRLQENAKSEGFKCAVVYVELETSDTAHTFNAFEATDWGVLYIDPQTDEYLTPAPIVGGVAVEVGGTIATPTYRFLKISRVLYIW